MVRVAVLELGALRADRRGQPVPPLVLYLAAIVVGISVRALTTATLFRIFGPRVQPWFERHAATGFVILILLALAGMGGYFVLRG